MEIFTKKRMSQFYEAMFNLYQFDTTARKELEYCLYDLTIIFVYIIIAPVIRKSS